MILERDQGCLVIIDVQERLVPAMSDPRRVIYNCERLMRAANRLSVPVVVSEQYPQGIGPTIVDLREYLPSEGALAKVEFSVSENPAIAESIASKGRKQLIFTGVEAHVCVLQSALGFKAKGYDVFVVADAVASRKEESETLALARMQAAGIGIVSTEMVLFEWLKRAGTPEFKDLMPLIK